MLGALAGCATAVPLLWTSVFAVLLLSVAVDSEQTFDGDPVARGALDVAGYAAAGLALVAATAVLAAFAWWLLRSAAAGRWHRPSRRELWLPLLAWTVAMAVLWAALSL